MRWKTKKSSIRRTVFLFTLILAMLASSVVFTGAASTDYNKQRQDLEKKIASLKDQQADAKALQMELEKKASLINEEVDTLQAEIDGYNQQISELNGRISALQVEIDEMEAEMQEKYDAFKTRLKAVYISGSVNELQVLLTADDFSTYLTRIEMLKQVAGKDKDAMSEIQEMMDSLLAMQAELDEKKQTLEEEKAKLDTAMDDLSEKKAEADAALAESQANIAKMAAQQGSYEDDLSDVIKKMNQYSNSGGGGGIVGSGRFCYPVPACSTVSCGYYGYANHNGIDFANGNTYGLAVVAADAGTVITVKYLNYSYGYHVYISHGNGFVTLYAHMSQIHVKEGQSVSKGQQIGNVGETGNAYGAHLHFGVLLNGSWVNPMNYL